MFLSEWTNFTVRSLRFISTHINQLELSSDNPLEFLGEYHWKFKVAKIMSMKHTMELSKYSNPFNYSGGDEASAVWFSNPHCRNAVSHAALLVCTISALCRLSLFPTPSLVLPSP